MLLNLLRIAALVVVFSPPVLGAGPFVYVSVAGENRIGVYHLDESHGQLKPLDSLSVDGRPGSLVFDPARMTLFASMRSTGQLASFRIDLATGTLSPLNRVPVGADPSYVAIDPSGRFLVSAYYQAGRVMVHRLAKSGRIEKELQSTATDEKAHCCVSDSSGRFWFVPHTRPNAIFQFRMDAETGELTPNDPPKLIRQPNTGPRHLWFHPTLAVAYSSDEQGRCVSTYRFDGDSGILELMQTLSTLPPDADQSQPGSTADIEVHPSGRFVYVANRGHDSIACFEVDQQSGRLGDVANTTTEKTTRSFNISPSGRCLIAAGQNSGKLAVFHINLQNGGLERKQTITAGKSPWWVLIR